MAEISLLLIGIVAGIAMELFRKKMQWKLPLRRESREQERKRKSHAAKAITAISDDIESLFSDWQNWVKAVRSGKQIAPGNEHQIMTEEFVALRDKSISAGALLMSEAGENSE